jgi:hypothetical protein
MSVSTRPTRAQGSSSSVRSIEMARQGVLCKDCAKLFEYLLFLVESSHTAGAKVPRTWLGISQPPAQGSISIRSHFRRSFHHAFLSQPANSLESLWRRMHSAARQDRLAVWGDKSGAHTTRRRRAALASAWSRRRLLRHHRSCAHVLVPACGARLCDRFRKPQPACPAPM